MRDDGDLLCAGRCRDLQASLKEGSAEAFALMAFRDGDETVEQLVTNAVATIGENIRVRRFVRYALGEEI